MLPITTCSIGVLRFLNFCTMSYSNISRHLCYADLHQPQTVLHDSKQALLSIGLVDDSHQFVLIYLFYVQVPEAIEIVCSFRFECRTHAFSLKSSIQVFFVILLHHNCRTLPYRFWYIALFSGYITNSTILLCIVILSYKMSETKKV